MSMIPHNSILILDNEYDIVMIFKRSLDRAGYSVFGFTDPLLALEHFKTNFTNYALIITDVNMPEMNGITFAEKIRKIDGSIKVILMSTFDLQELAIPNTLKVLDSLEKPIMVSQLRTTVSKYLFFPMRSDVDAAAPRAAAVIA